MFSFDDAVRLDIQVKVVCIFFQSWLGNLPFLMMGRTFTQVPNSQL